MFETRDQRFHDLVFLNRSFILNAVEISLKTIVAIFAVAVVIVFIVQNNWLFQLFQELKTFEGNERFAIHAQIDDHFEYRFKTMQERFIFPEAK